MKWLLIFISTLTYHFSFDQANKSPILVGFSYSNCDKRTDVSRLRTRIVDQWYVKDTFFIEVGTKATCCVDFIPSIHYDNSILELKFDETGTSCECTCCYQFIYKIIGLKKRDFKIKLQDKIIEKSNEKYLTYPIQYEILNGDTINYVDKYGLKQGYWFNPKKNFRGFAKDDHWIYKESFSYNNKLKIDHLNVDNNKSRLFVVYYPNGGIKSISTSNYNLRETKEFFENGKLKKITIFGLDDLYIWKEYYDSGNLQKERFFNRDDQLWAKYYYESGELMAEFYIYKESFASSPNHVWYCYNKEGQKIERSILLDKGLIEK